MAPPRRRITARSRRASRRVPLVRGTSNGRAVLDGRTVHVADMQTEADEFPEGSANARRMGYRTILCVPLMREGLAIGTIQLRRTEAQLFTDRQVALLETFADQAVIAIENVRLFKELEVRNRDLTETLEQQTATSEILRVISQLADRRPAGVRHRRGERRSACARRPTPPSAAGTATGSASSRITARSPSSPSGVFPPLDPRDGRWPSGAGRAAPSTSLTCRPKPTNSQRAARTRGAWASARSSACPCCEKASRSARSTSAAPRRSSSRTRQVALLETFADQAVIAIENVRLFKELEARNTRPDGDAGAADRDERDPARHLELADRRPARPRRGRGERRPTVRCPYDAAICALRRRSLAHSVAAPRTDRRAGQYREQFSDAGSTAGPSPRPIGTGRARSSTSLTCSEGRIPTSAARTSRRTRRSARLLMVPLHARRRRHWRDRTRPRRGRRSLHGADRSRSSRPSPTRP